MLHVTLRQLEYVVAVGRAGSLSTAADELNVSQPALSVAITRVESRIGEAIFVRRKGVAVTPTAFGRLFLAEAEALLVDAALLERPGGLSQARQTRVTLGILDELAPRWLAPILGELHRTCPETDIGTRTGSFEMLTEAMRSGRIDLALTYDLGLDASFERVQLAAASPWIWVMPDDPLAGRDDVALSDIADRPLILSDQTLSIQHMLGLFRRIGVNPAVRHRASSIGLLISLAANGEGTGLSYTDPAGDVSDDGRPVARAKVSDGFAVEPVVLAHETRQPLPLTAIRDAIVRYARFGERNHSGVRSRSRPAAGKG
ncbi:LysR family transcriptional regulator [Pseudoruegeria sp. HB172150]|uniref:LysR family transcriptional regulator n=1 Tax=Pseudoruegeria sp. HB172150 TaxID=2721164 RepID=UPI001557A2BC|nr:LysR family transcriptional regulator [Pseudoruegeria sp. HB172150]